MNGPIRQEKILSRHHFPQTRSWKGDSWTSVFFTPTLFCFRPASQQWSQNPVPVRLAVVRFFHGFGVSFSLVQ